MIPSWLKKAKSVPEPAQQESAPPRQYTDEELSAMDAPPPEADRFAYGPAGALWMRWDMIQSEKRWGAAKAYLAKFEADDAAQREGATAFVPEASIKKFVAGEFLCVQDHEIPRRFIQAVEVSFTGKAPHLVLFGMGGPWASAAHDAVIAITLASGKVYRLTCCRHVVDVMFDAVTNAWKHGEAA